LAQSAGSRQRIEMPAMGGKPDGRWTDPGTAAPDPQRPLGMKPKCLTVDERPPLLGLTRLKKSESFGDALRLDTSFR